MTLIDRQNGASVHGLLQAYYSVKYFISLPLDQVVNQILTFVLGSTENVKFCLLALILVAWSVPSISGLIFFRIALVKS